MVQMTRAQYDEIVRAKGPQWANNWRAQNGIQVEGMEPVEDDMYEEELPPVETQGALPSANPQTAAGMPSLQDMYTQQQQLGTDLNKYWEQMQRDRKAQYEQATAELEKRRFGPSRAEQLFQLAAAIGKPTYDRRFGSIMANVTPAFAEIEKANRTAAEERSAAARALREKYLGDNQQLGFNILQQRQKNLSALSPLAVAQMRAEAPAKVRTGFNPITGELTNMETGEPVANAGLRTLTPQQVATLSRDPRNRGMKFRTTDGRVMEIK